MKLHKIFTIGAMLYILVIILPVALSVGEHHESYTVTSFHFIFGSLLMGSCMMLGYIIGLFKSKDI